jgi:Na+-transporting NADH:ubiquinone oxidoreductase subunit NqrF
MKTHLIDNLEWHEVPREQVEDWDKFHRYVTAFLLKHGIQKATALVQIAGESWTISMDLKRLRPEQIN